MLLVCVGPGYDECLAYPRDTMTFASCDRLDVSLQVRVDPEGQASIFLHRRNLSTLQGQQSPQLLTGQTLLYHRNVIHLSSLWMTSTKATSTTGKPPKMGN